MLDSISNTYTILGRIGAGKGGTIYKAYHKRLKKEVVLKKINSNIQGFRDDRIEADILKNLRHTYLPQVLDFLEVDGDIYTVMDFIPGKSFQQYLDANRVFAQKQVVVWAMQICSTLSYLHSQKPPIIHSDIKPGNIMLTPAGSICLIDFNVSAVLNGQGTRVYGYSPGYAAPELIAAAKHNKSVRDKKQYRTVDARADIYSLGATLYHLMTGHIPAKDPRDIVDIREYKIQISDVFAEIIMKCLEGNPQKRFQTASQMFQALQGMGKSDKRYQALVLRQRIAYMVLGAAFILCGMAVVKGNIQMEQEKMSQYESYVRREAECIEDSDYSDFEYYYQKAAALCPDEIDAYYQKAVAFNARGQYGENITFITDTILADEKLTEQDEMLGNVYYLLGNAYEQEGKFEDAAKNYEKAIRADGQNSGYYRDYAIALTRAGQSEKAQKALEKASEQGVSDGELVYIKGEIAFSEGDYSRARDCFAECLDKVDDDYTRMRAYSMLSQSIDGVSKDASSCSEKITLLEQAKKELPVKLQVAILEQLAQAYIDMAGYSKEQAYQEKAVEVLSEIKENGWGTYTTDENLAVLYQQLKEYVKAETILKGMLEQNAEDYNIYKRLAFLETDKQADQDKAYRDYENFQEYYEKAETLYQQQLRNNETDTEMKRLEELYQQAVQGGWIS